MSFFERLKEWIIENGEAYIGKQERAKDELRSKVTSADCELRDIEKNYYSYNKEQQARIREKREKINNAKDKLEI